MGLGYGAGAAGFIVLCFALFILIFVIAGWFAWKRCKLKHSKLNHNTLNPWLDVSIKSGLLILLVIPIFVAVTFVMLLISNYIADRAEHAYYRQIYIQLDHPLAFGEIELPQGTWINRDFDSQHSLEDMSDIRQGLSAVHFPHRIKIADFEVKAFQLNGNLYLELDRDHHVMIDGEMQKCPAKWLLELSNQGSNLNNERYRLSFDWFKPSEWKAVNCFDGNVIVLTIDGSEIKSAE